MDLVKVTEKLNLKFSQWVKILLNLISYPINTNKSIPNLKALSESLTFNLLLCFRKQRGLIKSNTNKATYGIQDALIKNSMKIRHPNKVESSHH